MSITSKTEVYKKDLGPIINYFLYKLHNHISYLDDGETIILFASRAGVRVKNMYDVFCEANDLEQSKNIDYFWTSRFLLCKAYWLTNWGAVNKVVQNEYRNENTVALIKGIYKSEDPKLLAGYDFDNVKSIPAIQYVNSINRGEDYTRSIRDYLQTVNKTYAKYFADLVKGYKRVVIIDSGWQGTAHSILAKVYPNKDFLSLFFGVITTPSTDPAVIPDITGLIFNSHVEGSYSTYNEEKPETAFTLHRHLIEELFEPNSGSVENVFYDADEEIYLPKNYKELVEEELDEEKDFDYIGVLEYLKNDAVGMAKSPHKIHTSYVEAMKTLASKLAYPTKDDVEVYGFMDRSADFGKDRLVSTIVLDPKKKLSTDVRIKRSLWSQGQIAVEYEESDEIREKQYDRLFEDDVEVEEHTGVVGIITRTKNRPILFKRAAESVGKQTYPHYIWVVVNDGGELEPVQEIIDTCTVDKRKIVLVHNPKSLGMEAASNAGISTIDTDYLIIHDDDDSWEADFLKEAVGFLEGPKKDIYDAVVTGTTYVSEEIKGDEVIIHGTRPYNPWLKGIQISEMACGNVFAPIAFLYRKSIHDQIGGYDESLPVLGDWDFNLRFMLHSNIGILPAPLALYHHRDVNASNNIYSNSVIGGISKHIEFEPVVRNKFFRLATQQGDYDKLGMLINMGFIFRDMRPQIHRIEAAVNKFHNLENRLNALNHNVKLLMEKNPNITNADIKKAQQKAKPKAKPKGDGIVLSKPKKKRSIFGRLKDGLIGSGDAGSANFDEKAYLEFYPDVKKAVDNGSVKSAYEHFTKHGKKEGRIEFLK